MVVLPAPIGPTKHIVGKWANFMVGLWTMTSTTTDVFSNMKTHLTKNDYNTRFVIILPVVYQLILLNHKIKAGTRPAFVVNRLT